MIFIGCIKGAEVVNIQVKLHDIQLTGSISPALYSAAASDCVRVCLRHGDCTLLQPMMRVEVCLNHFIFLFFKYYFSIDKQKVFCVADRTQFVLDDLARRHSQILDVQQGNRDNLQESMSTIITRTPLAELIGYSSTLRTLTSGQANFTLAIDGYEPV